MPLPWASASRISPPAPTIPRREMTQAQTLCFHGGGPFPRWPVREGSACQARPVLGQCHLGRYRDSLPGGSCNRPRARFGAGPSNQARDQTGGPAALVVAHRASPMGHPAERALHNPSAWQHLEALGSVAPPPDLDHEVPLGGRTHQTADRVQQLAQIRAGRPASLDPGRQKQPDPCPFLIRQVRRITPMLKSHLPLTMPFAPHPTHLGRAVRQNHANQLSSDGH